MPSFSRQKTSILFPASLYILQNVQLINKITDILLINLIRDNESENEALKNVILMRFFGVTAKNSILQERGMIDEETDWPIFANDFSR